MWYDGTYRNCKAEAKEDPVMTEQLFSESISQICRNDKEGLRRIYEDYNPLIYSAVWEILRSREDAEDVTSDFFIRLWDAADTYRPGHGHRAWMLTIARNMAIDYLRKRRREEPVEVLPEDGGKQTPVDERAVNALSLQQALESLKEDERQIINLKIMGGLTFREIAAMLGRPQGTVAWCYRTAIRKLREVRL